MQLPTLSGDQIILRAFRHDDERSLQRHADDRQVSRYILIPHPYTLDDARWWIRRTHEMVKSGEGYPFAIALKESDQVIGGVGLRNIDQTNRNAELGFWLARSHWRQGYMTEAITLVLPWAFSALDLVRITACVFTPNESSALLLEKLGFVREGTLRRAFFKDNRWFDAHLYSRLREDSLGH